MDMGRTADELRPPDLSHSFCLQSADGLQFEFSNYVRGYGGLLDYVWYEPGRMEVSRALPMPSKQDVASFLPSAAFPSDHIAVVFDLQWRELNPNQVASDHSTVSKTSTEQTAPGSRLPAKLWHVEAGAAALTAHEAIAVPTDTLYGLAASAASAQGISRLYDIKGRPARLPLAVCVGDARDVARLGQCAALPPGLVDELLPGPVTVVLRRRPDAPLCAELNPGLDTLGMHHWQSAFGLGLADVTSACEVTAKHGAASQIVLRNCPVSIQYHMQQLFTPLLHPITIEPCIRDPRSTDCLHPGPLPYAWANSSYFCKCERRCVFNLHHRFPRAVAQVRTGF